MNRELVDPSRRRLLRSIALGAASTSLALRKAQALDQETAKQAPAFKLKYAPSLGMFEHHAGKDLIDQLKFMAGQGFQAVFDNGLMNRPVADQEAIAREATRLNMVFGPFVAYADFSVKSFVTRDQAVRDMLAGKLKTAIETAKRTNARWALVVPGRYDESLDWDYQTANVIENLKWCAGLCGSSGLTMVIEPLNPKNHPGLFLTRMAQSYQICKAVASPNCKIVDDIYHQQVTEGNIIPNIDACWEEIGAFHVGDSPGRKEPGTGELNYRTIFRHIAGKGYQGVLCMEHGMSLPGRDGERAVIEAYRACDNF